MEPDGALENQSCFFLIFHSYASCMKFFVSFGYFKYALHYITQKETDISPTLSKGSK